jgi:HEAT repeat protein
MGQRRQPVTPRHLANRRPDLRRLYVLLACAALALPAGGCASFWDEAFSRERDLQGYFKPPDPLTVIRDSTDGERRATALAALREPAQHGGNAQDQEVYVKILTTAATTDRDPLCRLGAIQALGRFKDPRAAKTLDDIFLQTKLPFTQDFISSIRLTALHALEKIDSDQARQRLILVARQPDPAPDAASADRRQTQDEKLIAIRALGKYRQSETLDTLVAILDTEKDGALRECAHQSLESATGKTLPADPAVWRAELAGQPTGIAPPTFIERVSGWWKQ